jgi:hypothetical protein
MRFPALSGRPAIFQVFFGFETSVPHFGHLGIQFPPYYRFDAIRLIGYKNFHSIQIDIHFSDGIIRQFHVNACGS